MRSALAAFGLAVGLAAAPALADGGSGRGDWSGFYAGLSGGYANGDLDSSLTPSAAWNGLGPDAVAALIAAGNGTMDDSGFAFGLHGGYNRQSGALVIGVEADISYLDLDGSRATATTNFPGVPLPANFSVNEAFESNYLLTLRPRIGFAFDRALLFATGGLAVTEIEYTVSVPSTVGVVNALNAGSVSETRAGWALGGGIEYDLDGHWSMKAEYIYSDFGEIDVTTTSARGDLRHDAEVTTDLIRVGVNYRY